MRAWFSSTVAAAGMALLVVGCGGGKPAAGGGSAGGTVSGVVVKGPVTGATVTIYRVDAAGVRGSALGTATTAVDGTYSVTMPAYNGHLEVAATGGTYTDEALQMPLAFSREMKALVADYRAGAKTEATVSPISTIAASLARFHVGKGTAFPTAVGDAYAHLNAHFGAVDWRIVRPASLNSPSVTSLSPEAVAGLVLAGLSHESKVMALDSGLTPGTGVSSLTLAEALWLDAADGTLDGVGPSGLLKQGTVSLDNQTARRSLGQAMLLFLGSPANATMITSADGQTLAGNVAADSDPYLFCPNQTAVPACAGGSIDLNAPVLAYVRPSAASGVTGVAVVVEATATDASNIATMRFTAPLALVPTSATITGTSAHIQATMDVSAMPDGPLTITVESEDVFHNKATKDLQVVVANHGPTINVSSPMAGVVKGTVTIQATASPQTPGATIASLTLVSPPPGVGLDTAAAADIFTSAWNTTAVLEGPALLTFEAVDSYGARTQHTVAVTVDNIPPGVISVALSAGAPIADATVKVVALDPATGAVNTAVGTAGVLGQGGPTNASGLYDLVLTAENYRGPVKVVAYAAGGVPLFYVDPTNPSATITVPLSMSLTSVLADYQTGTAVTVPVTLWTTLADTEVQAYVLGSHRKYAVTHTVAQAVAFTDHLFSEHMSALRPAYALRSSVPAMLTTPPTKTLSDQVYAAFPDVGLNQLAHDVGVAAGLGGGGVITAPLLVGLLEQDLLADGQFDGLGAGGTQLATPGSPPYNVDSNMLRVGLANGLDEFIASARNMTGLTRANLDAAGVYTAISQDTSDLFAGAAPAPFDNKPPSVTVAASYGPSNSAPVGAGMVVSGVVHITVTATDPSGIGSITLAAGATPVAAKTLVLDPAPGTGGIFTADFPSTSVTDGALAFVATVADRRSNSVAVSYTVTVDNTPPAITVVNPLGGFYGASIPLEATASDLNGVTSLTETAKGVTAPVPSPTHFVGSWTIPAASPDGLVTFTYRACDVVQNCTTSNATATVDRTAPVIALAQAVPAYTGAGNVTIVVTASDLGSGVASVTAKAGAAGPVLGMFNAVSGTWTLTPIPLSSGANTITIWGVDNASPANGGAGTGITVKVIQDGAAPTRVSALGLGGFTSELAMKARTNADGTAVFPAAYDLAPGAPTGFGHLGTVYRSSARVGAIPSSAAELEALASNSQNIPAIQYRVSYNPATDAPITAVSAAVTVSDGLTTTTVSGLALLPTTSADPNAVAYDLPLTSATIPALATVTANATVTVVLTMTDAAGNSGNDSGAPFSFTWSLLAPPLVVRQDTAWADGRDDGSAYFFKSNSAAYFGAWDTTNSRFVGGNVRVARYIVENPSPVLGAVGVTASLTALARAASTPLDLPSESAENGIGSTTNPLGVYGILHPSEPYPYSYAPRGAYWTTSAIAGCTVSANGTQIDPACVPDPANGISCATWPLWPATPPVQCAPGAAILAYGRAIHEASLTDVYGSPAVPLTAAGWYTLDGFPMYRNWGYWVPWSGGGADASMPNSDAGQVACTPGARLGSPQTDPTTLCPAGQVMRHVIGDTTNRVVCSPSTYFSAASPVSSEFSATAASVSVWANPQALGGERTPAATVGGSVVVPGASATASGQVVIYVARPASAPSPRGQFDWGTVTGSPRMEKLVSHWWQDPGATNLRFVQFRAGWSTNKHLYWCENRVLAQRREAAVFTAFEEVLDGALSLTARPTTATAVLGVSGPVASYSYTKTAVGSR